jgi:surfactin synthase thioesterase subunit
MVRFENAPGGSREVSNMTVRPEELVIIPRPCPLAERRLICFSYSGGGTAAFQPWAEVLPESTELVLACYPGREMRYGEPGVERWDALVADALAMVTPFTDRRYTLFGHSMGAWVAFEVAARLEGSGRGPDALLVSAVESPLDWAEHRHKPPTAFDGDEELLAWMRGEGQLPDAVLGDDDLRELALSLLRADLRAADSYRYVPGTMLRAPIEVLYGAADPDVDAASAGRWRELTSGACVLTELPGGHFYTDGLWARLPAHSRLLEGNRHDQL